jgi:hypothetical protein
MISSPPPVLFRLALHGQPTTKCFANRTPSTRDASMPNNKHVAILKKGAEIWNAWRDENPNIRPDLSHLNGADLRRADLRKANLIGAVFLRAVNHDAVLAVHRHRLPQSSSASRFTAGAAEFFILSQSGVRLSKKFAHVGTGSDRLGTEVQSTV